MVKGQIYVKVKIDERIIYIDWYRYLLPAYIGMQYSTIDEENATTKAMTSLSILHINQISLDPKCN